SALSMWLALRKGVLHATIALAFASLVFGTLAMMGYDALGPSTSVRGLVRQITAREGGFANDAPFFSVNMYEQTLPFYLKRPVTVVDFTDELELGQREEPFKALPSQASFRHRWHDLDRGYAIMDYDTYRDCRYRGVPMRELGRDPRRVIVSRQ